MFLVIFNAKLNLATCKTHNHNEKTNNKLH